jgi:hypothetical protein
MVKQVFDYLVESVLGSYLKPVRFRFSAALYCVWLMAYSSCLQLNPPAREKIVVLVVPGIRPCQLPKDAHASTSDFLKNLPALASQKGLEVSILVPTYV